MSDIPSIPGLSLDFSEPAPSEEQAPSISFATAPTYSVAPPELLNERAARQDYGLGEESPGKDQLYSAAITGYEKDLREQLAKRADLDFEIKKQDKIREWITNKGNTPLSDDEFNDFMAMNRKDAEDPNTYLEKRWAQRMFRDLSVPESNEQIGTDGTVLSFTPEQEREVSPEVDRIKSSAERELAQFEVIRQLWEENQGLQANQSTLGYVADQAKTIVPFYVWTKLSRNVDGEDEGAFLLGNDMEEKIARLKLLPLPQFAKETREYYSRLAEDNPALAGRFLAMMMNYSASQKWMDNAFSIADLTTPLPGVGVLPLRAATSPVQFAKGVKNMTMMTWNNFAGKVPLSHLEANQLAAMGKQASADLTQALANADAKAASSASDTALIDLVGEMQTVMNPDAIVGGIASAPGMTERSLRLGLMLKNNAAAFINKVFDDPLLAPRLTPGQAAELAARQEARDIANIEFGQGSDIVMNISLIPGDETLGGNIGVYAMDLGNYRAQPFATKTAAEIFAQQVLKLKTPYTIVETNTGEFGIRITAPVDEMALRVRDKLIVEMEGAAPKTYFNMLLGALRSREDTLPRFLLEDAKAAANGSQQLIALARQMYAPIDRLGSKSLDRLNKFQMRERDAINAKGERGEFSKTLSEFENKWLNMHGSLPSEKEAQAYFTSVQLNDFGWMGTNMTTYRDKYRAGLKLYNPITAMSRGAEASIEGRVIRPEDFWNQGIVDGKREDAGVLVMSDNPANFKYGRLNYMGANTKLTKKILEKRIAEGYKIIQLSRFGEEALREQFGKFVDDFHSIEYILVKDADVAPLPFRQIPFKPGGHVVYQEGYYVGQANLHIKKVGKLRAVTNYGDNNLYWFATKEEAAKATKVMEEARRLYNLGDKAAFRAYVMNNLPHNPSEVTRLFTRKGGFNKNLPFLARGSNETFETAHKLADQYKTDLYTSKLTSAHDPLKGSINLKWTGKRAENTLRSWKDVGGSSRPVWENDGHGLMDPQTVLDRATDEMMRGRYMEDLKWKAAERYIAMFGEVLKDSQQKMRLNPYKALYETEINKGIKDKGPLAAAAEAYRRSALEFIGTSTPEQRQLHWTQKKLADSLGIDIEADSWAARFVKDPARKIRSFAFHSNLGMFNPVQLLVQAQSLVHVNAVAGPVNGIKGSAAGFMMRAAMMMGDDVTDAMAKKAAAFGWKVDEFKESFDLLKRSGWARVGHEVATQDDLIGASARQSAFGRFLDAGITPFREGERLVRLAAWNAAYLEVKAANPGKKIGGELLNKILDRADLMSVNMTSVSNAQYQKGLWGIPTQFWSYQARLLEQFVGRRLSPAEASRVLAYNAALYGLPVAAGIQGFWPIHESYRRYLQDKNIQLPDDVITKTLNEGLISVFAELATGEDFDLEGRWGPAGLTFFRDVFSNEKTVLESMSGVSGSSIWGYLQSTEPVLYAFMNVFEENGYRLDMSHAHDFARNLRSYDAAYRLYAAMVLGKIYTKDGRPVKDASAMEGIIKFLTGADPQSVTEMYSAMAVEKAQDRVEADSVKNAAKHLRRSLDPRLSPEDRLKEWQNSSFYSKFVPLHKQKRILEELNQRDRNLLDEINQDRQNQGDIVEIYNKKYRGYNGDSR